MNLLVLAVVLVAPAVQKLGDLLLKQIAGVDPTAASSWIERAVLKRIVAGANITLRATMVVALMFVGAVMLAVSNHTPLDSWWSGLWLQFGSSLLLVAVIELVIVRYIEKSNK